MRIDKYLWSTRYFKTRNIATTACKKGQVKVKGQVVKPSREVYPLDEITVRKNQINYQLTVLDVPKSRVGAKLVDIYRKDTTPKEAFEQNDLLSYSKDYYRKKGSGRPTKKDRREIEGYLEAPSSSPTRGESYSGGKADSGFTSEEGTAPSGSPSGGE